MSIPLVAYVTASVTSVGTAAAAASDPTPPWQVIITIAAVLGALAAIWKALHLGELLNGTRNFLKDYNGEPARPGSDARPGLPETVAFLGRQLHEIKGRDAQLAEGFIELTRWAKENGVKIDRLEDRVIQLDTRVTDHRRRNDEQAHLLREALEQRARLLEERTDARAEKVDAQLASLSEDLLRAETYRASLTELGIPVDPPHHPGQ